jgi:hypothetical protein
MDLTTQVRYDVGFYIATDGDPNNDGAITGQCTATASFAGNTTRPGNFINLDAPPNCSGNNCQTGDVCGDINGQVGTAHNPLFVTTQISAPCPLTPGQLLRLPFATTWRQPGENDPCDGTGNGTTTNDVFPGAPSKCNEGTLTLNIISRPTDFRVVKDYNGTGVFENTGGDALYNVKVINDSPVAITLTRAEPGGAVSLTDNKYGDITTIHAANTSCTGSATPGVCQAVTATTCVPDLIAATCEIGGTIAAGPGTECSCTFTGVVPPGDFTGANCTTNPTAPGCFPDIVTVCANNPSSPTPVCRTDDASVPYLDQLQPPSLTKAVSSKQCQIDVTYNVVVTNGSAQDTLTLNTLIDVPYGDITQVQGNVIDTTCGQAPPVGPGALPFVIPASGSYACSFVGSITSCNTTVVDTVTGTATDDDGATYTPSGQATVVVTVTP